MFYASYLFPLLFLGAHPTIDHLFGDCKVPMFPSVPTPSAKDLNNLFSKYVFEAPRQRWLKLAGKGKGSRWQALHASSIYKHCFD
jgi:hypothetical protein